MKNNKLLAIRDTILMLLSQWDLDADECRKVLQMCSDEVDAADRRSRMEVVKEGEEE